MALSTFSFIQILINLQPQYLCQAWLGIQEKSTYKLGKGFVLHLVEKCKIELFTERRKNAKQIVEERLKLIAE